MTDTLKTDFAEDCSSAMANWHSLVLAHVPLTAEQARLLNNVVGNSFTAGYAMAALAVMSFVTEALHARQAPQDIAEALVKQLEPLASKFRGDMPPVH
jgi:hypothetical protein